MSVSSEYIMCPPRSDVISFYSSGDVGMFICSCHRKGCALQSSIPLTRAALSNRGNLSCNTLGVEVPSLCVFAVNEFGSLWNFHLNWLKTNVEAECCVCVHVRDEATKTCIQVSP